MTRAVLRKMFRDCRPRIIHWELYGNPLIRRILKISENARLRYEKEKRAIYHDKNLTDAQRAKKFGKVFDRHMATFDVTSAIQRQYDRAYERRELWRLKARRA